MNMLSSVVLLVCGLAAANAGCCSSGDADIVISQWDSVFNSAQSGSCRISLVQSIFERYVPVFIYLVAAAAASADLAAVAATITASFHSQNNVLTTNSLDQCCL